MAGTWIEISESALRSNLRVCKGMLAAGRELCGVVKANAYGHGLREVSTILAREGVKWLQVDAPEDAEVLRALGFSGRILLWSWLDTDDLRIAIASEADLVIESVDDARAISATALSLDPKHGIRVHLLVDLGDGLHGCSAADAVSIARQIPDLGGVMLVGVGGTLSTQDGWDQALCEHQCNILVNIVERLEGEGIRIPTRHLENTGAAGRGLHDALNLARIGCGWAGFDPSGRLAVSDQLRPVLRLMTRVLSVRTIGATGEIGYRPGRVLPEGSQYAVLSIGYASGLPEGAFQNGGVLRDGHFLPFCSAPTMNTVAVRCEQRCRLKRGDSVEVVCSSVIDGAVASLGGEGRPYRNWARLSSSLPRKLLT